MTVWPLPLSAACICGRVKMRVTEAPIITMACHCRGCQKLTSGPYSLTLMVPASGFEVEGETEIGGEHRAESVHRFCVHCKNWLFTTGVAGGQFVNFRPTMLDDVRWVQPYIESYVSEKLPGVVSGAKHAFEQFPEPHQYPELIAGFAREGAKPA